MRGKQRAFLEAMLQCPTITEASKMADISRDTAYKYLKDEAFKKELSKRQGEHISGTVRFLQSKLNACAETLAEIVENPETPPQIKINACNAIFQNCKAMTDTAEIIERLEEIERVMHETE